ncbi:hypothetical protein ACI4B7_28130, partial [Klebsiella pneumoniae]|uniref:hypothetical protein n=1 Tax=Klebsiella pneumoniae TaxID=573 RepID=UPI003854E2B8
IGDMLADLAITPATSHAAVVRETLIDDSGRVRALLASLDALDFAGTAKESSLPQLALVRELQAGRITALPEDTDITVSPAWQE